MTTTDEQALLAAIRDNPDDDTPRLMYADPAILYEQMRRRLAASLTGLSGEELHELGRLICAKLRTAPAAGRRA